MRTLWRHCFSSRWRATGNIPSLLTGRDAHAPHGAATHERRKGIGHRVVTLWFLCAIFSLTGASASGQRTDVVEANIVLNCGNESYPLFFAAHRTKIGTRDAEALSVILKSNARPNKVFSLYRYGSDNNNLKRDDDAGKAAQKDYKSNELAKHIDKFLASSFGAAFDMTRCSESRLIYSVLASFSTSSAKLLDVVKGIRPEARVAQNPASLFSVEPASEVMFSEAVFRFGAEWGFGGGDVDPDNFGKGEELAAAKGKLDAADKALNDAQKKLDAANRRANVRWWIVLGVLSYGLLATLAGGSLVGRLIKERKLRPTVEPEATVSYPPDIKAALLRLVEDTDQKCAQIVEQSGIRNAPVQDGKEFKCEHIGLVERVESLFLSNGYVVPKGLNELLTRAKKQFYHSWQFVPVVGGAMNHVRNALGRGAAKAFDARHTAKSNYREFVKAVEDYAAGLNVKEDGETAKETTAEKEAASAAKTQTNPDPARHAVIAESPEALASTVKDAFSTQVNPILKQTVEDAVKAAFNARSGEWLDHIKSTHSSREVLDRLRAAAPLVEPQRQLSDAEIESHITKLFSGVREMCSLFAPGQCSSAEALLRQVTSLRDESQKLGKRYAEVDRLPQLLRRMQARIEEFRQALSPVAAKDEDVLVCARRIVQSHQQIEGRMKDSAAFKYLVEQGDIKGQPSLLEGAGRVIDLAGRVPQLVQEADRQRTQIETLKTDREQYRTQGEHLNAEVAKLNAEVAHRVDQLGELETSARDFRATYAETVNGFLRHLNFQSEEAGPDGDVASSLRALRERACKAMNERPLFKSLRLRLLPGVEQLEKEIAEVESRGRGDVIRALSLDEENRNLNVVANLKKIISRLESFDGDQEKLWEHGLLDGFASGWLHHLLRADRLLQVYFADSSELAGLRNAVKGVALSLETTIGELGVRLFETKLLNPIPADRPVTRTRVGEITKVPEIKAAVEMIRQNGGNFVVDIIHFGLSGRSGVNEEVRIAIMNPVDWA